MDIRATPHAIHIFVCTNARHDGTPSCGDDPSTAELAARLKDRCKAEGWPVRVTRSGCLGPCAQGPNLMVYPQQVWFRKVAPEDLEALLQKIGELVEAGRGQGGG